MMRRLLLLLLLLSGNCAANQELHFALPNFPPYSYLNDKGEIIGEGVEEVSRVLKEMKVVFDFRVVPNYGKALNEIEKGRSDGFFLATQNDERDKVAVFSAPVTVNRWNWFFLPPQEGRKVINLKDKGIRVASHLKANTYLWLKKKGYANVEGNSDSMTLVKLLKRGRLDAVFLSESVFLEANRKQGFDEKWFNFHVQRAKPFGVYISKDYLKNNPDFMKQFNKLVMDYYGSQVQKMLGVR